MSFNVSRISSEKMDICPELLKPIVPKIVADPIIEDHRLQNWKNWMDMRRCAHRKLGQVLKRNQCMLLMNSDEEARLIQEKKELLEYTNIPNVCDKCELPACETTRLLIEENIKPEIVYTGVPTKIKKEKDVLCEEPFKSTRQSWNDSKYLRVKTAKLKHEIKRIEPHRPIMEELIVVGHSIYDYKPVEMPVVPDILVDNGSSESECRCGETDGDCWCRGTEMPVVMIKINNSVLGFNQYAELETAAEIEWHIVYDTKIRTKSMKYLKFHNIGNIVMSYFWERYNQMCDPLLIPSIYKSQFFFDKNENILLPGQEVDFPIWFYSDRRGIFQEIWELIIRPNVVYEGERLFVYLFAYAEDDYDIGLLREIDQSLDRKVALEIARDSAESMADAVESPIPLDPPYKSLFFEEDIFLQSNPFFHYNPDAVSKLFDLYDKLANPYFHQNNVNKPKPDAPKLSTGRKSDITEEEEIEEDMWMMEEEECEIPERKVWNLDVHSIRDLILDLEPAKKRNHYADVFHEQLKYFYPPRMHIENNDRKYTQAFCILSNFANTIDADAIELKNIFGLQPPSQLANNSSSQLSSKRSSNSKIERKRSKLSRKDSKLSSSSKRSITSALRQGDSKKSDFKTKMSDSKNSDLTLKSEVVIHYDRRTIQQYRDALFVRVYSNFSKAVEELSAMLDSMHVIDNN